MIAQTTHLASAEPCGRYHGRGIIMADSKQYTQDGTEILFWDLGEKPFRPNFNRPPRRGKRWVKVEKFRWVYSDRGEHYPYLVSYFVEELRKVDLPADRPALEWDL